MIRIIAIAFCLISLSAQARETDGFSPTDIQRSVREERVAVHHRERTTRREQLREREPVSRDRAPEPPPSDIRPSCKAAVWASVTVDMVAQAQDLIVQYNATWEQLRKLGGAAPEKVRITRGTNATLGQRSAYEGDWNEVLEALQAMLQKRLTGISCKLRGLGVTVSPPQPAQTLTDLNSAR